MTAEEFRSLRKLSHLSQRELAEELGMSRSRINDYETGRRGEIPRVVAFALLHLTDRGGRHDDC